MTKPPPGHLPFAALALGFIALAAAYQRAVPLFEAPDEPAHIQYVGFLALEQRLPLYGANPDVPGEGMQPPLYYAVAAPLFRALVDDPAPLMRDLRDVNLSIYEHIRQRARPDMLMQHRPGIAVRQFGQSPSLAYLRHLRWPSLLFGLLAVMLTYRAALEAFGDAPLATLAAGLLALNPQFVFASAYVSNDTAAAAVGAGALWLTTAALVDPAGGRRRYYLLAAFVGVIAILTKNSIVPGMAVAALVIFAVDRRPLARKLRDALWAVGLFALLGGPYLAWNVANRGDLLGVGAFWQGASHMLGFEAYGGALSYFTGMYWTWTFESYWARFGWINVRAPAAVYLAYLALSGLGVAGFVLAGRGADAARAADSGARIASPRAWRAYLVGTVFVTFAAHIWFNIFAAQPQGRHLFPAAPQIAVLLAIGIAKLLNRPGERLGPVDAIARGRSSVILATLAALAVYCGFGVIAPAYD